MALTAIQAFVGVEIPTEELGRIVKTTLDFEFPVVSIENQIGSLE